MHFKLIRCDVTIPHHSHVSLLCPVIAFTSYCVKVQNHGTAESHWYEGESLDKSSLSRSPFTPHRLPVSAIHPLELTTVTSTEQEKEHGNVVTTITQGVQGVFVVQLLKETTIHIKRGAESPSGMPWSKWCVSRPGRFILRQSDAGIH